MSYGSVDASTVRIFAVGPVGIREFTSGNALVRVAATEAGHGTGFWVGSKGLLFTANHVVADAIHIAVRKPGEGGLLPARVVYTNKDDDIALLQVDEKQDGLRLAGEETTLRVRQTVFAVGYPLDPSRTQAQSAKGIVAGHLDDDVLQVDMTLNPGNSGGPLLDEKDNVVGMVIARGDVESGVQGVGFAVGVPRLRTAFAKATALVKKAGPKTFTSQEVTSAHIVDGLLNQGAMSSVREEEDLQQEFSSEDFERNMNELADQVEDPDLLVFVAATMWNSTLRIRVGGARKVGTRTLGDREALDLANRLEKAAVRFVKRAKEKDPSVATRSEFVDVALGKEGARIIGGWSRKFDQLLRVSFDARPDSDFGTGFGFSIGGNTRYGLDGSDRARQFFLSTGLGIGRVSQSDYKLTYVSVELLGGISFPLSGKNTVEVSLGIAPSFYSTFGLDEEGGFELGYRATVGLLIGRWYLGSGVRLYDSSPWIQALSVGLRY